MDTQSVDILIKKVKTFKQKFYFNILLKGFFISFTLILSAYLLLSFSEYFLYFGKAARALFFFGFLGIMAFCLGYYVIIPLLSVLNLKKQISDEDAALKIGGYFANVNDKLLNTLQLLKISNSDLAMASLAQRSNELSYIPFNQAINKKETQKFFLYFLLPLSVSILLVILIPKLFVESSTRIINYKTEYTPKAPFDFILNQNLTAFKNEDYTLNLSLQGKNLPDQVYIKKDGRRYKMNASEAGFYTYTFPKIQKGFTLQFEASAFLSDPYSIKVIERPFLKGFNATINYPNYLNKKNELVSNATSLVVPEGTKIDWQFQTIAADTIIILKSDSTRAITTKDESNLFSYSSLIKESETIELLIKNDYSKNKEAIVYQIEAIKDEFPKIQLQQYRDTVLYEYLILAGNVSDDYGLKKLELVYRVIEGAESKAPFSITLLDIDKQRTSQSYYHKWSLEALNLESGKSLEYYLKIWDNDGVNGSKSSKSEIYKLNIPKQEDLQKETEKANKQSENQLNNTLKESKSLQKELDELRDKLKTKRNVSWQEKKQIEDLLKKKDDLLKDIEKLQKEFQSNNEKQIKFSEQNEKIAEKAKQLEQLMNELLDPETKKLYEELQKLLDQNNMDNVQKQLEKLSKKENNLEKELERALEMFKQIQFEQKMDKIVKDVDKLEENQEKLRDETLEKNSSADSLAKKQEGLEKQFEKVKKEMDELEKMNEKLENQNSLEDTKPEEEKIKENQSKSKESLRQKEKKKSAEKQKEAGEEMEKLSDKLKSMQQGMEMESAQENLDDLRDILENLITLSFDQEGLMRDLKNVNQSDPRYIELSQKQLKIKDDAKIVEDSLQALAKRVFQIQSFVTREVSAMNGYIEESLETLRKRRPSIAVSKQQFAMTSMNNLALMLNDVLKQMQQQMSESSKKGKGKKKKENPGLSDLQKQLNKKIDQLMKSGQSGRQLSEELAKMAAEQEMIRNSLKEMEEKMKGTNPEGQQPGNTNGLRDQMEKTETDLVNKRLSQETIIRQKEILTRLLEAEKSLRERELDQKREAQTAKELKKQAPKELEDYLKNKERQVELLKTIPPALNPYYKKQVNEYFKKINN